MDKTNIANADCVDQNANRNILVVMQVFNPLQDVQLYVILGFWM